MFIRKVTRKDKKNARVYNEYRLVESARNAQGKVRQHLVLNLGTGFKLPQQKWKLLTKRIKEIMHGQLTLFPTDENLEAQAQYYAKKIIKQRSNKNPIEQSSIGLKPCFETVDINNIQHHTTRTIGGEHVGLSQIKQLDLPTKLEQLGFNQPQVNIAIGQILGRLLNPGSELSTYDWLRKRSGLDELLDCDFSMIGKDQLYRVSDQLLKHKHVLEQYLYQRESSLFQLADTITLYDLTNTYFEGTGKYNDKASFGRSKEKRTDCRLVSLGLVLDGEGFLKYSEIFAGNISEPKTFKGTLETLELNCKKNKPTIILDAGIATEENIDILTAHNYDYIVVSRKQKKSMPEGDAIIVKEVNENIVTVKRIINEHTQEVELYCHSTLRAEKERSIKDKACVRFEGDLEKIVNALTKKNGTKSTQKVIERIGKLKGKYQRVAKFYDISITQDKAGEKVTHIQWSKKDLDDLEGIYCLRCSRHDLSAQQIWRTYITLTEVESAFRCMKSELGMRPIYHQKTGRVDGHIFITLLAYHLLHSIRYKLKQHNIHTSWTKIREVLNAHLRLTTTMQRDDGKIIHIRKTAVPEFAQHKIYEALGLPHSPCKTQKTIC